MEMDIFVSICLLIIGLFLISVVRKAIRTGAVKGPGNIGTVTSSGGGRWVTRRDQPYAFWFYVCFYVSMAIGLVLIASMILRKTF